MQIHYLLKTVLINFSENDLTKSLKMIDSSSHEQHDIHPELKEFFPDNENLPVNIFEGKKCLKLKQNKHHFAMQHKSERDSIFISFKVGNKRRKRFVSKVLD